MKHLLYLEDDEALAFVTCRTLEKRRYLVDHFADIDAVRAALAQKAYRYALLDLKIGNNTSLGLIRDIKQRYDIPIVLLTGYGSIRTAVQAMKLGAVNFLSKPCSTEEIISALEDQPFLDAATTDKPVAGPSLKSTEWEAIQKALDDNGGNISAAARQLRLHRRTLQRKLQKRHLEVG